MSDDRANPAGGGGSTSSVGGDGPSAAAPDALPTVETGLSPVEIVNRLDIAARRGKMPGFVKGGSGGVTFSLSDFGTPFESELLSRAEAAGGGNRSTLRFELKIKPRWPWVFAIVLVLTVWPGVWLTDSLLKTYITSYSFPTWIWYLPLTVPFVPLGMWTAIKRSRASGRAEAMQLIERIRKELGDGAGGGG